MNSYKGCEASGVASRCVVDEKVFVCLLVHGMYEGRELREANFSLEYNTIEGDVLYIMAA